MTTKRLKSYRMLISELATCTDARRKRFIVTEVEDILNWIYSLDDTLAVSIFKERYVNARKDHGVKPVAWRQVAQLLSYSEDHIKHIHNKNMNKM